MSSGRTWALIALAGAFVLYRIWRRIQSGRPLVYTDVPADEIREHMEHLYRRGLDKARLVVADQAGGQSVRLLKRYKSRKTRIDLELIVDGITRGDARAPALMRAIREMGIVCTYGLKGTRHVRDNVVCRCGNDVAKAETSFRKVMFDLFGLSPDSRFRLYIEGPISWRDEPSPISGKAHCVSLFSSLDEEVAKPYKVWHARVRANSNRYIRLGASLRILVEWLLLPWKVLFWFLSGRDEDDSGLDD